MEYSVAGSTESAATAIGSKPRARREADLSARNPQISEFADLYDQYFPKVFAYVYGKVQHKEAALDIVSDVFEKAFVKKQSLRSADAFGSWLFTIARNEVASHWRKEKPAAKAMQDAAWNNELIHQPPSPEDTLLHQERLHHLAGLLRQLPPREQEIISLKFDAELTNREIANILDTSEVNVRVTVFRALRKLRERMERQPEAR
jgi:RNA polymerase sigma-70 factor (ECF subfamily)